MHIFEVWAPRAESLRLEVDGVEHAMQRQDRGWWRGVVEEARPGSFYTYRVNGSKPLPDPRSAFQPRGIHGPSQVIDHSAFSWSDQLWQPPPLASAVIYELHIGTFIPSGTFVEVIDKLDYLRDLGVTHVELMPVNEFSGTWGWGYDGVDIYAPHHHYGTPDDLKQLVNACHAKGLAVLLDVVYNHFGPAGNYLNEFGSYLTDRHKTPWGDAVNLDGPGSNEVRNFFYENALMWLRDYHFDGLRLDAVHAFIDNSAFHFLEGLSAHVDALISRLGKHKVLIAESDLNDPRLILPREARGYGLDAQWADDLHHTLHSVLTGEKNGYYEDFGSMAQLAKALCTPFVYDGIYSEHRQRNHGRPPIGLNGHHFVVCAQNHDQVGNRAQGERLAHLTDKGRQKIAAALLLTSPYVPLLFQGEEFAASSPFLYFSSHEEEELGRAVSVGRTHEFAAFGWQPEQVPDPQERSTFERSKLRWQEITEPEHAEMLEWYRTLIRMRPEWGLTDGQLDRVEVNFDEKARWLTMRRGPLQVVVNFGADWQAIPVAISAGGMVCSQENGCTRRPGLLELAPNSVAILTRQPATFQSERGPKSRSASVSKA